MSRKMDWFRRAKYGMIIHWGLYSLLEGNWRGKSSTFGKMRYRNFAEWIMCNMEIPVSEYKQLVSQFNPQDFDAKKWVEIAKNCGMKYLAITTKHHDGFCLFDTKTTDYNVVKATPFGRDIVKELAEACEEAGLVFCIYYSQYKDWEDPNAFGNTWDYPDDSKKDFRLFFESKVKPQLRELLTNYGKIGFIWFDTPYDMPKSMCEELARFVREIQPDCLINSRIGYDLGDFRETGDNAIPLVRYHGDFQVPMTMNHSWGYSKMDHDWKSAETIQNSLMTVNQKGGNFLLNVGPDGDGNIPQDCLEPMLAVGEWLKINGESIYETEGIEDFPYILHWGGFTYKNKTLYMHISEWPDYPYELIVVGLETKVKKAYFLENKEEVDFIQLYEMGRDEHRLKVQLPEEKCGLLASVIVLELEGEPVIQKI